MKRFVFLCLSFVCVFMLFSSTTFAEERVIGDGEIYSEHIVISENLNFIPEVSGSVSLFSESDSLASEDIHQFLANAFYNFEEKIDISSYNISVNDMEELKEAISVVLATHPDLYYVSSSYTVYHNNETCSSLNPQYSTTNKEEVAAVSSQIESNVEEILSYTDDSMNDMQKLITIHDRLILQYEYDNTNTMNSAKDLFLSGSATGYGYTCAFYYVAEKAGITGGFISGDRGMWNVFYIEDAWYHANIWLDEFVPDVYSHVSHKYFLKSNDWLTINDSEYSFTPIENDSTKYDNAFWNEVSSPIITLAGHMFYIDGNNAKGTICMYNSYTDDTTTIYNFKDLWFASSDKTSYWDKTFAGLAYHNGRLYFNTAKSIISCRLDGTDVKAEWGITSDVHSIYGCFKDDGILYYAVGSLDEPFNDRLVNSCNFSNALSFESFFVVNVFEEDGMKHLSFINHSGETCNIFVASKEENSNKLSEVVFLASSDFINTIQFEVQTENYELLVWNTKLSPLMPKYVSNKQ